MEESEASFMKKCSVSENVVEDQMPVAKKVHQFYLVKVWHYEDPDSDAMIKRAEEVIQKMTKSHFHIKEKIRQLQAASTPLDLDYREKGIQTEIIWKRERLDRLKQILDKLSFANNAYSGKPVNSCVSVGEIDKQKLQFKMLHGRKSMADEKELLREISSIEKKDLPVSLTLEELNAPIRELNYRMHYSNYSYGKNQVEVDREAILKEIKQKIQTNEKAIANAAVNGELWNSLGSKEAIRDEINAINDTLDGTKKRQLVLRAKMKREKKKIEKIKKQIPSLQKQLNDTVWRKEEAYESILKLKKQYGEENGGYYKYHSVLKRANTLAEKKDILGLDDLCHGEVENFMSNWNSSKDFRDDYKKRIVHSLNRRQLCMDGRMNRETDEKSVITKTPRIIKPEALSKPRLKWLMKDAHEYDISPCNYFPYYP